jgi:hypothetical protein
LYGTYKSEVKIIEKTCSGNAGNAKLINTSHKEQKRAEVMASFCFTPLSAKLMKNKWARNRKNDYIFSNDLKKTCR